MDTLPLLRILASTSQEMLSRGEIIRRGITNEIIDEAERLGEVIISSSDFVKDGNKSSLASVILTLVGEETLDNADE
jgi:hypothetical protein